MGIYYGETQDIETVNWEEVFKKHLEETARINKEREEKIERAQKQEKSWELLKECIGFLKENEKAWKIEEDERLTERQKKEKKNQLKQLEKQKREEQSKKETQRKITETWQKLPEHEQTY